MVKQSKKSKLLACDSDQKVLSEIIQLAGQWYDVLTTDNPAAALNWLRGHTDVAIFITEHLPQLFEGASLLENVRNYSPDTRRIVLTSFADLNILVNGLHTGVIQKLIQKPIVRNEFLTAIVPPEVINSPRRPSMVA